MYLAKFFHRSPGDDDRELLLIPGGDPIVLGIYMDGKRETQRDDFLREEFSGIAEAASSFRRHTSDMVAAGYMETAHTRYTLRDLLPDPQPKAEWQKGLDELMLAALSSPLEEQTRHLATLENTEAAHEPLYLWLAAHHSYAAEDDNKRTIRLAEDARDMLASRKAAKAPHYAWSINDSDLGSRIFDVLSWAHLRADNPTAALEAVEQAHKVQPSQDRGVLRATILCDHFPDRQEEAFDAAFQWSEFGGYEKIMALPAYEEYVARRARKPKSDKGWRWKAKKPATEAVLRDAEAQLGATLPDGYRKFLTTYGPTELLVRLPEHSGELCFYPPTELAMQRDNLFRFVTRIEKDHEKVCAYFRKQYGVSLRDLVPVAEPANQSRSVLIHLEKGDRFGWCFHWDHDGAWELEKATPSFDAALKALTDGIKRRDTAMLSFLGIYID
jgi:SMI1 / KNR4 family (SUKH-1)